VSLKIGSANWRRDLYLLRSNWDNEGAEYIRQAAIDTIDAFCTVPCATGGVQLEIHKDGYDIEIYVGPDGRIESILVCHEKGVKESGKET
jgi:hypothetical protein